jgi:WXG100 family type VII secretion target
MVTLLFASVPVLLESSAYASAVIHIDPNTVATTTAMAQTNRWNAFALPEKRPRTEAGTTMVVFPSVQCKSVIFSTLATGIGNNGRHISTHCFRKGATMPQYQVDSEQIQASSAAVNSSIAQIRQAVGGMYTNLNALQNVWRGSAATQFTTVAAQWRAAQQQMEASLESIQRALAQASNVYADAETQASRLFAG